MEVEIKITGSGLQFEAKVSLFQATQIMSFISRAEQTNTPLSMRDATDETETSVQPVYTLGENSLENQTTYESPHAAIAKTKAKTNPQKIVALAYYLGATSTNQRLFSVDEILTLFKKAGESTPKNINRDFREAVSAGYIFQEDKGSFRLLSSVDSVQSEGFPKVAKKRTGTKSAGGKRAKSVIRDGIKKIRVTTSMDGYLDFFKINVRADHILWTIKYAESQGIDGINRSEIIDFIKRVGGGITSKNFTTSNTPNMKNSYLYIENDLFKLTPKGADHLKNLGKKPESK